MAFLKFENNFHILTFLSKKYFSNADKTKEFNIIENGCSSDFINFARYNSRYAINAVQVGYKSFTFEREASAALDLQIKCEVQFCIQYEIEAGTCDPETCPQNYSLRHFIPQE